MKFLIWEENIMLRSFEFLKRLKYFGIDFVLIGGWAVYFLTKYHMSRDIDFLIQDRDLWKLRGYVVSLNGREKESKLEKYGFSVLGVDLDVYAESRSDLLIPVTDVFSKNLFIELEEMKVLKPEYLLLLKLKAHESRGEGMKGLKDRCDILSLCLKNNIDFSLLPEASEKYKVNLDILEKIVLNSKEEFNYVFNQELDFPKIKKIKKNLISKIRIH